MVSPIYRDSADIHACKDPAERSRLAWASVLRNHGLVCSLAKKVYGVIDDDTVSECQLAMHEALLYADPSRGSPFRVGIWCAVRRLDGRYGVHIPNNLVVQYRTWMGRGGDPMRPVLNGVLGEQERTRIAWLLTRYPRTLDLYTVEGEAAFEELTHTPDLDLQIDLVQLEELLDGMSERSRDALLCVYRDETLSEIGVRYGVSRERIRQLHAQLFRHLQKLFSVEVPDGPNDPL